MTTTHATASTAHLAADRAPGALQRIVNVARLHLVNRNAVLWLPLFILTVIVTASMVMFWLTQVLIERAGGDTDTNGISMGGASSFIVIYMLVVAIQAINLTFPFAQGLSVTRRDFYFGSALAFVGLSVFWSLLMTVLSVVEQAFDGWGMGGYLFTLRGLGVTDALTTFAVYLLALLFFFFVGMAVASMYVRWKAWGIAGFFTVLAFLIVGLVALATFTDSWEQVGAWFMSNGTLGVATWSLVPTVLAAVTGFAILRRATPRE